jgi:hypothetical protein
MRVWLGILKVTMLVHSPVFHDFTGTHGLAGDEYQRMKILIDAPDPSTNYLAAKSRRDTGSGEWLLNGDLYKRWQNAPQSLLWLHGIRMLACDLL